MQITSKGQVTIPQDVRDRLGFLPHTEVELELAGDHARFAILPSIGLATKIQGPFLPSSLSLCHVSSPHYVVSDIKVADDKRGIIVRGYEIADQGTPVNLKFPLTIKKANATNLIEDDLPEQLDSSAGSVQFTAGHCAINAMRISGGLAQ